MAVRLGPIAVLAARRGLARFPLFSVAGFDHPEGCPHRLTGWQQSSIGRHHYEGEDNGREYHPAAPCAARDARAGVSGVPRSGRRARVLALPSGTPPTPPAASASAASPTGRAPPWG